MQSPRISVRNSCLKHRSGVDSDRDRTALCLDSSLNWKNPVACQRRKSYTGLCHFVTTERSIRLTRGKRPLGL